MKLVSTTFCSKGFGTLAELRSASKAQVYSIEKSRCSTAGNAVSEFPPFLAYLR